MWVFDSNRLLGLLAGGLVSIVAFAQPASAEEPRFDSNPHHGTAYSQLADYVRQISGEPAQLAKIAEPQDRSNANRDDAYSALLAFAQQSREPEFLTADVRSEYSPVQEDAYSALRDFVRRVGNEQPQLAAAEQPKAAKPAKAKAVKAVGPDEATLVGSQVCAGCHARQAAAFAQTLMGKIGKVRKGTMECENCHGAGSLHVAGGGGRGVGGMISFRADDPTHTVEEINAICLQCHEKGERILWRGSTHEMRDVACTNCHTIMTNVTPQFQLAKATEMDTCFQCHKNVRAAIWRNSHMPVREGKMTCSNCHNPHGSYSEALLREATVNDVCYKCHAEKRGPFLWEHPPVRENCLNCHDPHGSVNDFMLKISRPRLCQQCHANLTGHPGNPRNPTSVYALNRECQNCHSQHHGSNSPAGSRFIR